MVGQDGISHGVTAELSPVLKDTAGKVGEAAAELRPERGPSGREGLVEA